MFLLLMLDVFDLCTSSLCNRILYFLLNEDSLFLFMSSLPGCLRLACSLNELFWKRNGRELISVVIGLRLVV